MCSKINKSLSFSLILILFLISFISAQDQYQAAAVGFYNLENLFDTTKSMGYIDGTKDYQDQFYHITIPESDKDKYEGEDSTFRLTEENLKGKKVFRSLILTEEFTPDGPKAYDDEKYDQKLKNLSRVISELGSDVTKTAPVVVGVVEVETRKVVEDLVQQPALQKYNYGVVHYNSLDKRGIDCALIYQKDRFQVTETHKYELEVFNNEGNRDYTRDIIRVSGKLDGENIHFIVNHWPSRRGGEAASAPKRKAAAELLKSIFREIQERDPNAKIIAMGDFNDDPVSPSFADVLKVKGSKKNLNNTDFYDPMVKMYKDGMGTLAYRDTWNLFDQIILSEPLIGDDYNSYEMFKTGIYSPSYLISQEGQYKGYPNRMYGGDNFRANGYSDHFPVYTILLRKVKK